MTTALIVGGSGCIGTALINELLKGKFQVHATYSSTPIDIVDERLTKSTFDLLNFNGSFMDVTDEFDHLIITAGLGLNCAFIDSNWDEMHKVMDVNLINQLKLIHQLVRSRRVQSTITLVGSVWGHTTTSGRLAYSVSKAGLLMAVNSLATELSSKKIRVNSVSPGFIDSEMTRRNLGVSGIERIMEQIPSEHLATPQDISRTIKFLISDDARYINGADICVDGGFRSARTY